MRHSAKRRAAGRSQPTRLTLEALESRTLLSADFGSYGPERSVVLEVQGDPAGDHRQEAFIDSASYEAWRREEFTWIEIESGSAVNSRLPEREPSIEVYSTSWVVFESHTSSSTAPVASAAMTAMPKPTTYPEKLLAGGPAYSVTASGGPSQMSPVYMHTTSGSYLPPSIVPATTANLVDAKAQLDANRSTVHNAAGRASAGAEPSERLVTATAQRVASRDNADVRVRSASESIKVHAQDDANHDDDAGGFVELNASGDAKASDDGSSLAGARRAAIDAALSELSRMRDGAGEHGRRVAGKTQRDKLSLQAAVQEQQDAQTTEDAAAGMILLRPDGDAEIRLAAGCLASNRPVLEAMIGAYRAMDFGSDEAPAPAPAAPINPPSKPGVEEIDAAMSQREQEAAGRAAKVTGAALAAGAMTLAVRHELLAERKKRRAAAPR